MSTSRNFLCVFLLSMTVASIAGPIPPAHAKPPLKLAIKRQEHRNDYTRFQDLIDSLGIVDGMTILDIGAGPGYASFLLAEKMHGTGKVYATEIREDFVNHIADEAKVRGLGNLVSVLVQEEGLDDFYGKHRYDLVFLSNVYHCLNDRIGYFRHLRGFLNRNARLVLVLYNQTPLFSVDDLSNVDGLVASLFREPDDNPFIKNLSPRTLRLLDDASRGKELKTALVDDFNRMLVDPRFYANFYGNSYFRKGLFTPPERDLANWLLMSLKEDGALEKPVDQIDAKAMRMVVKLNRLFFIKRFGDHLAGGGLGAYIPAGDANRQTSKYVVLRELDAAGYQLDGERTLSPYFDAVIMTPRTP